MNYMNFKKRYNDNYYKEKYNNNYYEKGYDNYKKCNDNKYYNDRNIYYYELIDQLYFSPINYLAIFPADIAEGKTLRFF
jgi:hypothetical protein